MAPNAGMPGGMFCICGSQQFQGTYQIPAGPVEVPMFGRGGFRPDPIYEVEVRVSKLEDNLARLLEQFGEVLKLQDKILARFAKPEVTIENHFVTQKEARASEGLKDRLLRGQLPRRG